MSDKSLAVVRAAIEARMTGKKVTQELLSKATHTPEVEWSATMATKQVDPQAVKRAMDEANYIVKSFASRGWDVSQIGSMMKTMLGNYDPAVRNAVYKNVGFKGAGTPELLASHLHSLQQQQQGNQKASVDVPASGPVQQQEQQWEQSASNYKDDAEHFVQQVAKQYGISHKQAKSDPNFVSAFANHVGLTTQEAAQHLSAVDDVRLDAPTKPKASPPPLPNRNNQQAANSAPQQQPSNPVVQPQQQAKAPVVPQPVSTPKPAPNNQANATPVQPKKQSLEQAKAMAKSANAGNAPKSYMDKVQTVQPIPISMADNKYKGSTQGQVGEVPTVQPIPINMTGNTFKGSAQGQVGNAPQPQKPQPIQALPPNQQGTVVLQEGQKASPYAQKQVAVAGQRMAQKNAAEDAERASFMHKQGLIHAPTETAMNDYLDQHRAKQKVSGSDKPIPHEPMPNPSAPRPTSTVQRDQQGTAKTPAKFTMGTEPHEAQNSDHDVHALFLSYLQALLRCQEAETWEEEQEAQKEADAIYSMLVGADDEEAPEEPDEDGSLKAFLSTIPDSLHSFVFMDTDGQSDEKFHGEWTRYEGPRGGTGWKNSRTGRVVYSSHPHPPGYSRRMVQASQERARDLGDKYAAFHRGEGEALSPEELHELAKHIQALPVHSLRNLKNGLAASWGNAKKRSEMADALTNHVKGLSGTSQAKEANSAEQVQQAKEATAANPATPEARQEGKEKVGQTEASVKAFDPVKVPANDPSLDTPFAKKEADVESSVAKKPSLSVPAAKAFDQKKYEGLMQANRNAAQSYVDTLSKQGVELPADVMKRHGLTKKAEAPKKVDAPSHAPDDAPVADKKQALDYEPMADVSDEEYERHMDEASKRVKQGIAFQYGDEAEKAKIRDAVGVRKGKSKTGEDTERLSWFDQRFSGASNDELGKHIANLERESDREDHPDTKQQGRQRDLLKRAYAERTRRMSDDDLANEIDRLEEAVDNEPNKKAKARKTTHLNAAMDEMIERNGGANKSKGKGGVESLAGELAKVGDDKPKKAPKAKKEPKKGDAFDEGMEAGDFDVASLEAESDAEHQKKLDKVDKKVARLKKTGDWKKDIHAEAEVQGIGSHALKTTAKMIREQDRLWRQQVKALIDDASKNYKHYQGRRLATDRKKEGFQTGDHNSNDWDVIAKNVASESEARAILGDDESYWAENLYELVKKGVPAAISEEEAYTQALNTMASQARKRKEGFDDERIPD